MIRRWLEHPLTRGLDLDAPETTALRRHLIRQKPFLQRIYQEWYGLLLSWLPPAGQGLALEIGAGGGFARQVIPRLLSSEILWLPEMDLIANAQALPLAKNSLRGIILTNVFHHLPEPRRFLAEANRCLMPGGVLAMIEPWASGAWPVFVYRHLHHEPFDPQASTWGFPPGGPLSAANGALPWIIFERDKAQFESEFPELQIVQRQPLMPIRYLLSGGVSLRSLAPAWTFRLWKLCEAPFNRRAGMFALIVLRRRGG